METPLRALFSRTPRTSKRTAGTPQMFLGTSDTETDTHRQATPLG